MAFFLGYSGHIAEIYKIRQNEIVKSTYLTFYLSSQNCDTLPHYTHVVTCRTLVSVNLLYACCIVLQSGCVCIYFHIHFMHWMTKLCISIYSMNLRLRWLHEFFTQLLGELGPCLNSATMTSFFVLGGGYRILIQIVREASYLFGMHLRIAYDQVLIASRFKYIIHHCSGFNTTWIWV